MSTKSQIQSENTPSQNPLKLDLGGKMKSTNEESPTSLPIFFGSQENQSNNTPVPTRFKALPDLNVDSRYHAPQCYLESPIKAEIPKKIIESFFNMKQNQTKQILEFKRKKVINSTDQKFLTLLKSQDYSQKLNLSKPAFPEPPNSFLPLREEDSSIQILRKSPIIKKLSGYWAKKSQNYPSIFKKILKKQGNSQYEQLDLTGHFLAGERVPAKIE